MSERLGLRRSPRARRAHSVPAVADRRSGFDRSSSFVMHGPNPTQTPSSTASAGSYQGSLARIKKGCPSRPTVAPSPHRARVGGHCKRRSTTIFSVTLICRRLLIACTPVQTRGVDQYVEWFVKWFSVHRASDRIAKQLFINNVLHKSPIEYAIEPRGYPLGTVVVVHRGTMNTRDENRREKRRRPREPPRRPGEV